MTLFKQIIIAVTTFVVLIFMAVAYLNFNSLNNYINAQLGTNARHTANSMGLAIKSIATSDDYSSIETIINSMFDSGYYQMIRFEDIDGKIVAESSQEPVVDGIPQWFIKFAHFQAPIESSEVMTGWSKFGTLYVQSNTGLAYYELYSNMKDVFYTLIVILLVALVATYVGLKIIFKPLVKVQDQAEAILDNKFIIQEKVPFTTDMRRMVLAMNSMVQKVKDVFEREAKTLDKYQELLYKDAMSGLYNRRYFQTKFSEYMASEEYSSGTFILLSFKELLGLKRILGFEKWQSLIIKIAQILQSRSDESRHSMFVARLNENDFAILIPSVNSNTIDSLADEIIDGIKDSFEVFGVSENECDVNMAIVDYSNKADLRTLLSTADVTLASARESGNFKYKVFSDNSNTIILGKERYKDLIANSINNDQFKFAAQKVLSMDNKFEQYELYLRLVDDEGKWQMASYFMPMVNELNLGATLDLYVFERVGRLINKGVLPEGFLAINIGKEIMANEENLRLLEATLKRLKTQMKNKIYIEIPNKDEISIASIVRLSGAIKDYKFGLGIDHFSLDAKSIDKLKEINPDYVKIQAANIIDFFSENNGDQTKRSLDVIMSSKDIRLVGIGVESEEQKQKLLELGITSMQGIYIDDTKNIG